MTAKEFLTQYLEYKSFWSFKHNIDSEPAKIRLRRLNSVLSAFEISNLENFEKGEFLQKRKIEENQKLIKRIQNLEKDEIQSFYKGSRGKASIVWLFKDLLKFRKEIYEISQPWSGFLEGFDLGLYFGKIHQEKLKKLIRENTNEIDEILCLIIDPQKREISEKDLIESFNYDFADLDTIDRECRIENY